MELSQLRSFLAVAEELHFGRAAERLKMAQPPLSRSIKQLESELNVRLFDRSTRSVALTSSGSALVGPAHEVIEALARAEFAVRAAEQGDVGRVRIAFAGASTYRFVASLARSVRARRPGIQLELMSQNYAQPAMRRLLAGETDLALGRWDVVPPGVHARVVLADSLRLAVPATHPLVSRKTIDFASLANEPFVALDHHEGSVLPDRLRRLAQSAGFVAQIVQNATDTHTALALVSAEVGCMLTLQSVAANSNDSNVVFLKVSTNRVDLPDVDMRAVWRHDDRSAALQAVLDELPILRS